jgi:hypothetical protein
MNWNKLLRSTLNTASYILDQTADQVERASDRASEIAEQARSVIYPQQDHTLRNILSFAAGVGVGIGAGILLAPASGAEIRTSISDRVQDISDKVKNRVSNQGYATGTESR